MTIAKGKYAQTVGTRAQVWHGTAYRTSGGLTKSALMMSHGRIVSVKKHNSAKREKRLEKAGYFTKKGKFGFVRKSTMSKSRGKSRKSRKSRSMKGGTHIDGQPDDMDGDMDGDTNGDMTPMSSPMSSPDTEYPPDSNSVGGRRRSRRRKHRGGSHLGYSPFK